MLSSVTCELTNSSVVSKKVERPPFSTDFILTEVTVGIADSIGRSTVLDGSLSFNFLNSVI